MATVNPTLEAVRQFERDTPDDAPIVMLNLLTFRDRADYGAGPDAGGDVTGAKAYERYAEAVLPLLFEVGGLPLWIGKGRATLIGPGHESWDELYLVWYPSRRAFLRMIKSPAYQAVMRHRTAALSDSRLIETRAVALPRWVLRAGRAAVRARSLLFPRIAEPVYDGGSAGSADSAGSAPKPPGS
jgi:uncharacterized protein (DUF1330 family)